jgi:transcription initiation factor TFIIIB Brf1 subunit/transcription initiation factor TFIIB
MQICLHVATHDDIGNTVCSKCGIVMEEMDSVSESSDRTHRPKYFNGFTLQSGQHRSGSIVYRMLEKLKLPSTLYPIVISRLQSYTVPTVSIYIIAAVIYCSIREHQIAISLLQFVKEFDLDRLKFLQSWTKFQSQLGLRIEYTSPTQFLPMLTQNDQKWKYLAEKLICIIQVNVKDPEAWATSCAVVAQEMLVGKQLHHDQVVQLSDIVAASVSVTKQRIKYIHSYLRKKLNIKHRGKLYYLHVLDYFL